MRDLFSVVGRTALVTGGTSGIGQMIAQGFVENGCRTYVVGRSAAACTATAAELSRAGECRALSGDISTLAGVEAVAEGLSRQETRLDILVNNAGSMADAPIETFSEDDWDSVVDLNLKSVFFLTQKCLPLLRAAASEETPARIINIGSIGGLKVGPRENYSYAAAKAALHHMTRQLSKRLGPEHITVNAIAPGFVPSRMTQVPDEMKGMVLAQVPLRRMGTSEDMAGAALFLASRAGGFVTGIVLSVDGGMSV